MNYGPKCKSEQDKTSGREAGMWSLWLRVGKDFLDETEKAKS
jgi:hypothetical protein